MKNFVTRFISMVLMCSLAMVAASCGGDSGKGDKETTTTTTTSSSATTTTTTEAPTTTTEPAPKYTPLNYERMKGTWLFQYTTQGLFRDGANGQRDIEDYTDRVTKIVTNLERDGYNTLFLQVRPYGDSFYPSEFYCSSNFVTSGYGGEFAYDPLEIFIRIAHEHNISIHAWLNPMRLMTVSQMNNVPAEYPIKKWLTEKENYVVNVAGRYYLNPSYEETRQLVINGAVEICEKYDIDGIHLDDYFYPSEATDDFDSDAYFEMVKDQSVSRHQFRFDNVNKLVKGLYDAIHNVDDRLLFGISPAGNISNNRGYLCADVDTWCREPGYIDYIAPQVYWSFDYKADFAKFDICSESWANLIKTDSVRLILGMGLYRAINPTNNETDPGWYRYKDNIKRMLEYSDDMEECSGWILFSYESMYDAVTGAYNNKIARERENFLPVMKEQSSVPIKYE